MYVLYFRVRNAERLPGVDEILLPGERGNRLAASRLASGIIELEPNLLHSLRVGLELMQPEGRTRVNAA